MRRLSKRWLVACAAVAGLSATGLAVSPVATSASTDVADTVEAVETASDVVFPEAALQPSTITPAQQAALAEAWANQSERAADGALARIPGGAPLGEAPDVRSNVPETQIADDSFSETARIRRNFRNTRASAVSSTLAEPAAANEGAAVLYTGNTYASTSLNFGSTWSALSIPAGPSDAPFACCDQDIVRAHNRDRIFSIMLYLNSARTNGVVRIFVRSSVTNTLCTYLFDPAGSANNIVPDYPHIALSANYLYLGANNLTNGSTPLSTTIKRYHLAEMAACGGVPNNTFTRSNTGGAAHRVFVPSEGFDNSPEMLWGQIETTTSLRIYRWPESTTFVSQFIRGGLHGSNFTNPDCRGGVGNFDFIEKSTAWSASGFRLRGARSGPTTTSLATVSFWWNVNRDASHPQGHVHGASFRLSDLARLSQPIISNSSFCFGFPMVDGNAFGEHGLSIAAGGRFGGGGSAAQGYVGVDENTGTPISFNPVTLTASGTHNRSDGRYGDYFTVRTKSQCRRSWVGTNYSLLNGNTSSANVNARYIEYGPAADATCLNAN
jgi:hypothetical protein